MGCSYTVLSKRDGSVVCSIGQPPTVSGHIVPDFKRNFTLYYQFSSPGCCVCYMADDPQMMERKSQRLSFHYNHIDCAKFREYEGINISVFKYRGSIVIVSDDRIVSPNSSLAQRVALYVGIESIEELFEEECTHSKHIMHFTLCSDIKRCSFRQMPAVDEFLVYKFSSQSDIAMNIPPSQLGGRLRVENMAKMDTMTQELGSSNSKLITPSFLSDNLANVLWQQGAPLRLVNIKEKGKEVMIRKSKSLPYTTKSD